MLNPGAVAPHRLARAAPLTRPPVGSDYGGNITPCHCSVPAKPKWVVTEAIAREKNTNQNTSTIVIAIDG